MKQEQMINESKNIDIFAAKIKEYYKEYDNTHKECYNCVGNGCDDCRGCDTNIKLGNIHSCIIQAEELFKNTFNISYKDYKDNPISVNLNSLSSDKIISAANARKLTDEIVHKNDVNNLNAIMDKINKSIKDKKYSCSIDEPISDTVINKLKTLGYSVKYWEGDPRDPNIRDSYDISW